MEGDEPFITANKVLLSLTLAGASLLLGQLYRELIVKPRKVRAELEKQGIKGPVPVFLYGNIPEIKTIHVSAAAAENPAGIGGGTPSHAWPAKVFPHLHQWLIKYATLPSLSRSVFLYSTGSIQTVSVMDLELVKQLSLYTSFNLGKPSYISRERGALLGEGIFASNGPYWDFQRKTIAPEFYLNKVKGWIGLFSESTSAMLQSWESKVKGGGEDGVEISVDEDMRSLSADIISRACFGTSYSQGKDIFIKLHTLQQIMSKGSIGVPGLRYVPTKDNRDIWRLKKEIDSMVLNVVKARNDTQEHDKDLLQLILDAANNEESKKYLPDDIAASKFVIDNCKNIYFAGHETTAISASWCLMLLAAHPDWQTLVRAEVLEICGHSPPDADKIRSMKLLNMVIQEALRLYPPVAYSVREALDEVITKGIRVPKGVNIQILIPFLHHHPEIWGSDVLKFNPERFRHGISRACQIPQAYMPFGMGMRTCIGQNFAMTELKVIMSAILSRFSFSLSPAYQHSPVFQLVIKPRYGVRLHVRALE